MRFRTSQNQGIKRMERTLALASGIREIYRLESGEAHENEYSDFNTEKAQSNTATSRESSVRRSGISPRTLFLSCVASFCAHPHPYARKQHGSP